MQQGLDSGVVGSPERRKERHDSMKGRQRWATRTGLILALAGNAIGLGNFLRFPVQAAQNGGGAFMIPYFFALAVIGLPMMWMECTIGRYGGRHNHGHAAGMLHMLWDHPVAKYIGALGLFIPFTIGIYYIYITSWTLAFSVFSLLGSYDGLTDRAAMGSFLRGFQGVESNQYFGSVATAYVAYMATLGLTAMILLGGVAKGIERLAKIAIPLLFALGALLAVRVLTLGAPVPAHPEWNVSAGLGFVWNPDFSALADPGVWVAAAGQVFFSLSIGWGIIHTYVSYLEPDDDVVLTGMSTAGLNEFAEVVLGGTIAITAAVCFFGVAATQDIANGGAFDLGFQAMPVIFQQLPAGNLIGALWFALLFFAGLTSAVAMAQPMIALVEEGFGATRRQAVFVVVGAFGVLTQPVIFLQRYGFLDEIDYWVGTIGLVVFALLEIIVFAWMFGIDRGWAELERGALVKPPAFMGQILRWVTPSFLAGILFLWVWNEVPDKFAMTSVAPEARSSILAARGLVVGVLIAICLMVRKASKNWQYLPSEELS
ncbi:MAG: NSS family neurotransmitter:Na+ symporter [Hyphomicrobiaceae bacterium]